MNYGLTLDNEAYIRDKAKTKRNGVYTARGVVYRVEDGKVTHYATSGKVSENFGNFLVDVGEYKWESEAVKMLKNIN